MLLTLANITHDAQKERRERLKQKYGDKTIATAEQKNHRCTSAEAKRGCACGRTKESWGCRNPCKVSVDQKQLLFFSTRYLRVCECAK